MPMQTTSSPAVERSVPRPIATVLLCWLAMIGVDLFLHAGVLAPLYDWDNTFLLRPMEAFARIPAGYGAFLLLAIGLAWLLPRLGVNGARRGAVVGGVIGAVTWSALLLGLWSISTAPPLLLAGWWLGQAAQLALVGGLIGAAIGGTSLRRLAWWAVASLLLGIVTSVVLQSTGYATAPVVLGS